MKTLSHLLPALLLAALLIGGCTGGNADKSGTTGQDTAAAVQFPDNATTANVAALYKDYDVTPLSDDTAYCWVESKPQMTRAHYLSRLLKFSGGSQIADVTFYGYTRVQFINLGADGVLVGLNSLPVSYQGNPSAMDCKVVLLDANLLTVKEQTFAYPDLKFTNIDTLYQTANGFHAEILNQDFGTPYYMRYSVDLDKNNEISHTSKQKIQTSSTKP